MVSESFIRTAMLYGEEAEGILKNKTVALYGVGGVGGSCGEALARSGIGHIHITDSDTVSESNLNRQCVATKESIGIKKVLAMKDRMQSVGNSIVTVSELFVLPENINEAVPNGVDYIIDAIDTVSAKLALIEYAHKHDIPIISCMGMGNRTDPTQVRTGDVFSVTGCPLARTIRRELKKRGIYRLDCVYSLEMPIEPLPLVKTEGKRQTPGSCAFVPPAAGLAMAGFVVNKLLKG